jgi:hypothetical protein
MLSFHSDEKIKEKYLNRIKYHREMDNIIQGTGWENGKGCAIGCTLENYDHSKYPIELGIPVWLAKLEDVIFEKLSNEKAKIWTETFLNSIPIGVDLESVKHKTAIIRMDNLLEIQNKLLKEYENTELNEVFIKVISSIQLIKKCHELELNKNYCDWSAAESSAWSSAWSAAWSAARSAARSAESVGDPSVWSAAELEAESAAWEKEADNLIEILKNHK